MATIRSAVSREAPPATSRSTRAMRWSRLASSRAGCMRPLSPGACGGFAALGANHSDVGRLRALLPLAGLELDLRALGQRLEALAGDVRVVHEEILLTPLWGDEAVALRV